MTGRTPFGKLAALVLRHPKATWIAVAVVTLLSALAASTLTVDSNLLALMSGDDPAIAAMNQLGQEEGGVNLVSIAVTGAPEGTGPCLRELAAELETSELVDYALYDVDDELAWRLGVINMDMASLEEIRDRLKGALSLGPSIQNPFIASRLLSLGPLTEQLTKSTQGDQYQGEADTHGQAVDQGPIQPAP